MTSLRLLLALSLTAAATLHAGAKKQSAVSVRFYTEGGAEGGEFSEKVMLLNGKPTYMASLPLITEREIKSYMTFPAPDGSGTYGAYFRLDSHGTNLLAQHTMSRRGSWVLAFFNGRRVADLYIDRPVRDGIAYIPSGLSAHDVSLLEITFPPLGREGEKPVKKKLESEPEKVKPTPTPKPEDMPRMSQPMRRQPDGTFIPVPPGG